MQALILADREIIGLTGLGNSNEPWMVEIDGVPIIERMLTQLDNSVVSRIILITRDNKESLIEFTKRLNLKTELVFLENKFYKESKSIYSIFLKCSCFVSWTRTSNGFDSSVKFVSDGWDLQI